MANWRCMESCFGVFLISSSYGVAEAHVQGGMVGDLSLMFPEFMQAQVFIFGMQFPRVQYFINYPNEKTRH
ncbi:hypothetical protein MKW98_019259 [Papaver atlanticum]|uniref:Uncharacterized protein n=1 Tax=Papaver atlanticum TaxID=357466 RepID=A0AAD4XV35_9MAGN|nr:hypothetical protein MKW98_019259 [Papaver atlanticum]